MIRIVSFLCTVLLVIQSGIAQQSAADKDTWDAYTVHAFHNGSNIKLLNVLTSGGELLCRIEVPRGVFLSLYADKSDPSLASRGGAVKRTVADTVTYSGKISIRTELAKNVKPGPMDTSMLKAPFRLDLENAIVRITELK